MASRKRTPEQEARLRAVRRMQDDVYEGIGANRQYGPGGEEGVERESDPRSDARQMARSMTMAATKPLRELRGDDADERHSVHRQSITGDPRDLDDVTVTKGRRRTKGY